MSTTTVAVVQAGTVLGDTARTMEKLESYVAESARLGAELAVFPEAFLGGYPKGMVFGASLGIRTDAGRQLFGDYSRCAIEIPGPETDALLEIARSSALHLVVGVIERAGGTLYCTALYLGPEGRILGKHRKLVPTAIERIIWGCGDGTTLGVVASPIGKFGALICWENYMPLARVAMYQQGVEFYCAPTVDDREAWIPTVRHIAREGRCFVLSACQFLTRDAYPPQWLDTTQNLPDVPIRGGSCIIDPLGTIIAGPLYDQPGVLVAKVDRAQLAAAKFDFDVTGHYARPDVFKLRVSE
jgi:nitrilase